jgi:hypothetical protein
MMSAPRFATLRGQQLAERPSRAGSGLHPDPVARVREVHVQPAVLRAHRSIARQRTQRILELGERRFSVVLTICVDHDHAARCAGRHADPAAGVVMQDPAFNRGRVRARVLGVIRACLDQRALRHRMHRKIDHCGDCSV